MSENVGNYSNKSNVPEIQDDNVRVSVNKKADCITIQFFNSTKKLKVYAIHEDNYHWYFSKASGKLYTMIMSNVSNGICLNEFVKNFTNRTVLHPNDIGELGLVLINHIVAVDNPTRYCQRYANNRSEMH